MPETFQKLGCLCTLRCWFSISPDGPVAPAFSSHRLKEVVPRSLDVRLGGRALQFQSAK